MQPVNIPSSAQHPYRAKILRRSSRRTLRGQLLNFLLQTLLLQTLLLQALLMYTATSYAAELSGRLSLLGSGAHPRAGDLGSHSDPNTTPRADQQSLRLMLDAQTDDSVWSVHLKTRRQQLRGLSVTATPPSDLFRYRRLAADALNTQTDQRSTRLGYEFDRLLYQRHVANRSLSIGRQPIDWGSGRFWQPLNVFGAFAPTDLDTDYKPGIDAALFNWYPSAFSSLSAVYALAPAVEPAVEDSAALYYRRPAGQQAELALLAGRVIGNNILGASLESDWRGLGWRIEGAYYARPAGPDALFWIAGIDYQFTNGTLVSAEWYDHGLGSTDTAGLTAQSGDRLTLSGLRPHRGRQLLGLTLQHDITPLLHGGYTLLISPLHAADHQQQLSSLHQLNLRYSLSNESDLLLSLQYAAGKGLNAQQAVQSEFGHLPASLTLRLRLYF